MRHTTGGSGNAPLPGTEATYFTQTNPEIPELPGNKNATEEELDRIPVDRSVREKFMAGVDMVRRRFNRGEHGQFDPRLHSRW